MLWTIEELKTINPALRPAVRVWNRETNREHIGTYSPHHTGQCQIMYGARCQVILVSWQQLKDALELDRPVIA
jgi:hypothetical protein